MARHSCPYHGPNSRKSGSRETDVTSYSSGRLKISFSSGTQAETWTIVIKNPNGQSASASLQVNAPPPTITSLNPNPMTALATPQTLTIYGANFTGVTQVLGSYPGGGVMSLRSPA